jgi:hypothetical protein
LLTEAANLNGHGKVAGHRQISKTSPDLPGNFGIEMRQNQHSYLAADGFEIWGPLP